MATAPLMVHFYFQFLINKTVIHCLSYSCHLEACLGPTRHWKYYDVVLSNKLASCAYVGARIRFVCLCRSVPAIFQNALDDST